MSSWVQDDAFFLPRDTEAMMRAVETASHGASFTSLDKSDRHGPPLTIGEDSPLRMGTTDEIVSPTSSSSSNGSHGGLYGLVDEHRQHRRTQESVTEGRQRGQSAENELQFGEIDDDDRLERANSRSSFALDFVETPFGSFGAISGNGPSSATRKTSSSFSDLGDYDDFMFADTTPNGTPNTPTFRSIYDATSGSFGRSIYSGMSNGHYVSPGARNSLPRNGRHPGRTTPTPRCGVPMDESQPIVGNIYPVPGEILRTEVENAAYIVFYKVDEAERDDLFASSSSSEDSTEFTDGMESGGEITTAFFRPPRSLISLGAAGHKVRTTNCFTKEYAHPTRSLGRGLFRASTSVGSAFLKGAAGLVTQTYQGGANGGVFGFAKGLGMGMLGLGTHTVKGAFRGVGQVTNVVGEMVMGTAPHFSIDGMLFMTNYRLIWVSQSTQDTMEIPLASVIAVDSSTTAPHVINIECKSLLRVSIAFRDESTSYEVLCGIWELYSVPRYVFAHAHYQAVLDKGNTSVTNVNTPTSDFYDAEVDYRRLKLLDEESWMQLYDNSDFSLCPSYPAVFVVPSEFDDEDLRELSSYRSASRIPAVVWRHPHSGALMSRCAQPCAGLSGYIVAADQKYVAAIQRATSVHDNVKYHFFDARSQMAATANSAQGKGTEDPRNYPDTELHFCDIANIHAVRSSYGALSVVCQPGEDRDGSDWAFQLRDTFWFMHISRILASAQLICQTMCQGESVMVHCSDGWDRTPQLTALIQILLDPHYRTLCGFMSVIEKEWCSFGHMFRTRYSQDEGPGQQEVEEQSPIFVQWLDALWQIWRQQPWAFEFNEVLLACLYDNVFSGLSGTFLYNNERERREREAERPTRSLWSIILEKREQFVNAEYDCAKNFNSVGIILPFSSEEDELVLWENHLVHADPICRKYS